MGKKFTSPFGEIPPTIAQQLQFNETFALNKTRTHEYRRWSDRATVLSYNSTNDTYRIAMTTGSNATDTTKVFDNVRAIIPADLRKLDPGTTVAIGYVQERREQPIILGVGTIRTKVTDIQTTPLSTNIQLGGGTLTLTTNQYDNNFQPGDPSTADVLGQDPLTFGSGGCTYHVHAVGGVGEITWDWSYDGADKIMQTSGQNDFRLTFGVEGGAGSGNVLSHTGSARIGYFVFRKYGFFAGNGDVWYINDTSELVDFLADAAICSVSQSQPFSPFIMGYQALGNTVAPVFYTTVPNYLTDAPGATIVDLGHTATDDEIRNYIVAHETTNSVTVQYSIDGAGIPTGLYHGCCRFQVNITQTNAGGPYLAGATYKVCVTTGFHKNCTQTYTIALISKEGTACAVRADWYGGYNAQSCDADMNKFAAANLGLDCPDSNTVVCSSGAPSTNLTIANYTDLNADIAAIAYSICLGSGQLTEYTGNCGSGGSCIAAPCASADGTTLTATDSAGNMATAVINVV